MLAAGEESAKWISARKGFHCGDSDGHFGFVYWW